MQTADSPNKQVQTHDSIKHLGRFTVTNDSQEAKRQECYVCYCFFLLALKVKILFIHPLGGETNDRQLNSDDDDGTLICPLYRLPIA